jgi:farnesyl diphosphate synthase
MDGVSLIAINDSFLLESMIYRLLRRYFRSESYYVNLLEDFHEVFHYTFIPQTSYQTELGQCMDLITAPEDDIDLSRFSIQKYDFVV